MKKLILFASVFSVVLGMAAQALPDLNDYRKPERKQNIALQETFNDGLKAAEKRGWKFPATAQWDTNGGTTGSGALLLERKDLKDYESAVARISLELEAKRRYVLTLSYKTADVPGGWASALPAVTQTDENGKTWNIHPSLSHQKNDEWHAVEYEFIAAAKNVLICQLFRAKTGKIWFDDIKVEPAEKSAEFYLTRPFKLTLDADNTVEYRAYLDGVNTEDVRNHLVYAELGDKKAVAALDKKGSAVLKFDNVADGKYPIKAKLLDSAKKQIVAEDETTLYKRPATGTGIDTAGRMVIDGKPVLAIGVYGSWIEKESEIKDIADAGFTFLLDYSSAYLNITPGEQTKDPAKRTKETNQDKLSGYFKYGYKTPEGRVQVTNSLDILAKHGLKYIQGYSTGLGMTPEYNHPAVIGKYYADENPVTDVPKFRKTREEIAEKFPGHITLGLTDKAVDCVPFAKAFDVFGYDVYPIRGKGPQSMITVRNYTVAQLKTGIAGMFVPQAFSWNGWGGTKDDPLPSTEQLRAMVLLPAIYGVRIYCYYSYTSLTVRNAGVGVEGTREFWEGPVTDSVKCLRSLEPWLLSDEKAPAVKIANKEKSVVDAAAFTYQDKTKVIITACGPGKADAEIEVGIKGLKSRYGQTVELGNGKYRFTGQDIASDVLE